MTRTLTLPRNTSTSASHWRSSGYGWSFKASQFPAKASAQYASCDSLIFLAVLYLKAAAAMSGRWECIYSATYALRNAQMVSIRVLP